MKTILQVEDDPNDVLFLQKAMKKIGVTNPIQVARDGQEAVDYLQGAGKFADRVKYPFPCLVLLDLNLEVVGEAADWATTLAQAPARHIDMLLIDWDLLPDSPTAALDEIRRACPAALVIVLISHLDARQQAALSAGADAFISKGETSERVADRLRAVAASVRT